MACLKTLHKHHIKAQGIGVDGNPTTIGYAKATTPIPTHLQFLCSDILKKEFCIPEGDMMISSHFIYHFKEEAFQIFLQQLHTSTLKHVIFSELYRSRIAYFLFWCFGRIAPISKMARQDGLLAIQRAFSIPELENNIYHSGIRNYTVQKKPWFRMLAILNLHR